MRRRPREGRPAVDRPAAIPLDLAAVPVVVGIDTWSAADLRPDGLHYGVAVAQFTAIDATTGTEAKYQLLFTREATLALHRSLVYSLRVADTQRPEELRDADTGHDVDGPARTAAPAAPAP